MCRYAHHTRLSTDGHFIVEETNTLHIIADKTLQVSKARGIPNDGCATKSDDVY